MGQPASERSHRGAPRNANRQSLTTPAGARRVKCEIPGWPGLLPLTRRRAEDSASEFERSQPVGLDVVLYHTSATIVISLCRPIA